LNAPPQREKQKRKVGDDTFTLEARIAAAAAVEKVVSHALNLQDLIDARMALDMLAHRLRDGGPETSRQDIRERVQFAAEKINGIVPRSFLRAAPPASVEKEDGR